jgi:hypothetical protein
MQQEEKKESEMYPDPLENLDKFQIMPREPIHLPITSIVFDNREEMMPRIARIAEWHRKWFRFDREVIVSSSDPGIHGLTYVNCGYVPPKNQLRLWYSDMCVHGFVHLCQSSHLLIWQWDGFIINPELWQNDFLRWDYIGAAHGDFWFRVALWFESMWPAWPNPFEKERRIVGNGGFSLRSKKFLLASNNLSRVGMTPTEEDLYLCVERRKDMQDQGVVFCPAIEADKFSTDSDIVGNSWGFHNRDHLGVAKKYLEDRYLPK